jgi:hypothetical protein
VRKSAAEVILYLQGFNGATASSLTGTLLSMWQDAQWMKEMELKKVKNLSFMEKIDIKRRFPPPPNIDFRGAT